ncbi:hypothetical protein KIW84_015909 [Lathyrus oleraceus]|uniref:PB1-like domain-containing protein n=1 Tax=Pisum sativum TaxID=3888 RepID=A0A9D5BRJ4_PEA|nr:hypothetical protein KIW84_015909 [Pisum sativum]
MRNEIALTVMEGRNESFGKQDSQFLYIMHEYVHVVIHHEVFFEANGESCCGGSVTGVKCDVDKWSYFEVLEIVKELGYEESRTVIYKDLTIGLFTLSDDKGVQEIIDLFNVDEIEDVTGKLVEEVLNGKADGVSDLNKTEVGGTIIYVNEADDMSEGEVKDISVDVNEVKDMSVGVVRDNNVCVNETEDMSEGGVGDNHVDVNGVDDISDSDDVSFQYDSTLDVAFQDSDEDGDGLVEEDITHLLGYDKEAEAIGATPVSASTAIGVASVSALDDMRCT